MAAFGNLFISLLGCLSSTIGAVFISFILVMFGFQLFHRMMR